MAESPRPSREAAPRTGDVARDPVDGRFERYCRESGRWAACATADADDAMRAVWTELLVSVAPRSGLPRAWARSLRADDGR